MGPHPPALLAAAVHCLHGFLVLDMLPAATDSADANSPPCKLAHIFGINYMMVTGSSFLKSSMSL